MIVPNRTRPNHPNAEPAGRHTGEQLALCTPYPLNFTLMTESGSNFWHRLNRFHLYRKTGLRGNTDFE